jgi:L-2-hydroxyglutarate oxidase
MLATDFLVIGGGIVGLSVAHHLRLRFPKMSIVVLEKENGIAKHQSGRNSGVIHSGIYYKPGSAKAINCREGKKQLEEFCVKNNIPFNRCGKIIVATNHSEVNSLMEIRRRGKENGIKYEIIDDRQIKKIEPSVTKAIIGIHVPETGIVDYSKVCAVLAQSATEVITNQKVTRICDDTRLVVANGNEYYHYNVSMINCAGLYSDRIAEMAGLKSGIKIVPFRGDYFTLSKKACRLVKGLIYPVPDPRFPFLGAHFTSMINGGVECGPNAVLSLAREGYSRTSFDFSDFMDTITFPGTLKLMAKHMKVGIQQMLMSYLRYFYVKDLQKLVPAIRSTDLMPRPPGIRAQALDVNGNLVDDFVVKLHGNGIHVLNAPSPAATACLNIGKKIVEMV